MVCVTLKVTLGSNIASLQAQRRLEQNTNSLSKVFERLSSGQRINRASDDAAGLSVASQLNAKSRVFNQGVRNLNDGLSLLSVADGALGSLSNIVIRQRELAAQSANGTYSAAQRADLDREAQALFEEYGRILNSTEYNGRNLFDVSEGAIQLQGGFGSDGAIESNFLNISLEDGVTTGLGTYTNYNQGYGAGTALSTRRLVVADFNGDGIDDVLAARVVDGGGGSATAYFGLFYGEDGGNTFALDDLMSTNLTYFGGPPTSVSISMEVLDVGIDGDSDVRFHLALNGAITSDVTGQLTNDGTGDLTLSTGAHFVTDESSLSATGDFNNDGILDSVLANSTGVRIALQDTETSDDVYVGDDLSLDIFSLTTASNALSALDALEAQLDLIARIRGQIGSSQSRLYAASNVLQASSENFLTAESRIRDADTAHETAQLTRFQILNQTAAAVLSQANLQPNLALQLLRT